MDAMYYNFRCHAFPEVENTFFIYVRQRCGNSMAEWIWLNKEDKWFWTQESIDDLAKEFVDRYLLIANAPVRDRRELLAYYQEALFILNYIYRKSPERRNQYRAYEESS